MSVDRETTVKKAEDLVREGKFDLAIEAYLRLVEDQPRDVGAANALGDLYAKVGNRASAVTQFVKIGDTHRESGFIPKAVAFYKKALKVDPASDHALSQLAQIAVEQALFADATLYLNRLLQRRREQNNEAGVADVLVRLGGFPTATADAKMAAARAAAAHLAPPEMSRLWIDAADALERAGRPREAVDVLMQAASIDSADARLRHRVAVACADTGQIERAQAFLSFDTAGDRGDLLMALARHALGEGRHDEARRALHRVILVAPDYCAEAESLLAPLLPREPEGQTDEITIEGFGPEAAVSAADDGGVIAPETTAAPSEAAPPAVGDLRFDAPLGGDESALDAEAPVEAAPDAVVEPALADEEAPAIASTSTEVEWSTLFASEDLEEGASTDVGDDMPVPFEPAAGAEADTSGDAVFAIDEDAAVAAEWIEPEPEAVFEQVTEPDAAPVPIEADAVAVDVAAPEGEAAEPAATAPEAAADEGEPQPAEASAFQPSPADASTIAALTAAAENPALLFQASAQLGRLLLRLERGREGVAWLERAIQSTTAVREQRLDVMYELADALERFGERQRALDVFADLDFDAASYRDVPERMARLRRALEEGRAP